MTEIPSHHNIRTHFSGHPERHYEFMLKKIAELKLEYLEKGGPRGRGKGGRRIDPGKPVACWSEEERYQEEKVNSFVMILRSSGCGWYHASGCSMCGYFSDTARVGELELLAQLENAKERYKGQPVVKLFTSGSFFLDVDMPPVVRAKFLELFGSEAKHLIVESRPELVVQEKLKPFRDVSASLEVALGLETSNDFVLKNCINKGFFFEDFVKAATLLQAEEHKVKTYLLLKPPFLSEKESLEDTVLSIKDVAPYSNTISVNPMNIQNFTFVRYLWREGLYKPSHLWTLVEVLKKGHHLVSEYGSRLMSAPTGAGTERGVSGCGNCEEKVLGAVKEYSLGGDVGVLDEVECGCFEGCEDGV